MISLEYTWLSLNQIDKNRISKLDNGCELTYKPGPVVNNHSSG